MTIHRPEAIAFLQQSDFKGLFRELLAWDRAHEVRTLVHHEQKFVFEAFAQKAGVTAYACRVEDVSHLDYQTRHQIERAAATIFPSHLFVFFDAEWMVWQWSRRELQQPRLLRSVGPFHQSSSFEPILQKLDVLAYDIESGNVQAADVDRTLQAAFNVEPVTKAFYKQFEQQYQGFLADITGIAAEYEHEFASLMLNRLMFLYFMQRKGFLGGEDDYLRARFDDKTARVAGHDDYLHGFLAPLFFQILSVRRDDRTSANIGIFGDLIYLNGGLFSQRDWEKSPKIAIPDAAFEKIFDFFRQWKWHLDERPTKRNDEINPDVLGYVFEKFINQKQMGAYYTKEDITGYISKNTMLPFLFEKSGLDPKRPFALLSHNIERYIYPAVKHGCDKALPGDIALGIQDVARRDGWNRAATPDLGLPTEIWREVVARRQRFELLTSPDTLAALSSVADLITHNLDIAQWMIDVIADISDARELEQFWAALQAITILDPTVGSGAFLFAAMGVLQPVYSACLERMDGFVAEADARAQGQAFKSAPAHTAFRDVLREIEAHPNRNYAIYKKLAVQNLFGVDIMPEATEICKLRLFLKLAAQVAPDARQANLGIEPLPDIDFNIRAGNTLVGFATAQEVESAAIAQMSFGVTWPQIEIEMRSYGAALDGFRLAQLQGGSVTPSAKARLQTQHDALVETLNQFNAGLYHQMPKSQPEQYAQWRAAHQPFHWCAEFYSVLQTGGFDVIIGNPPYVEYAKVRGTYTIKGYETESCGNLYAFVIERALKLLSLNGRSGLIVPISVVCTDRTSPLQRLLLKSGYNWHANFDTIPGRLFGHDVEQRLSVVLHWSQPNSSFWTTVYQRFSDKQRDALFSLLQYQDVTKLHQVGWIPRVSRAEAKHAIEKMGTKRLATYEDAKQPKSVLIHRIIGYYSKAFDFVPHFSNERDGKKKSEDYKEFFINEKYRRATLAIANSNLFYWYWHSHSDGFHCGYRDVWMFPVDFEAMESTDLKALDALSDKLMKDLTKNSEIKIRIFKATGRAELQEFEVAKSKPIIDEIDRVLAQHYGFTDEELDFIINYDIKYRMGRDAGEA